MGTERRKVHTFVCSDVHFGSDVCQAKLLLGALREFEFEQLVLIGDIYDNLNFARLRKSHHKTEGYILRLARHGVRVVWVSGNHDLGLRYRAAPTGDPWVMTYEFEHVYRYDDGVRPATYGFIHGHQFDKVWTKRRFVSDAATWFYNRVIQPLDRRQRVARWMKRNVKLWLRMSDQVARGAIRYARKRGWNVVMSGHTHAQMEMRDDESGIVYYNDGTWADAHCHFITIGYDGVVEIHERHNPQPAS